MNYVNKFIIFLTAPPARSDAPGRRDIIPPRTAHTTVKAMTIAERKHGMNRMIFPRMSAAADMPFHPAEIRCPGRARGHEARNAREARP